MAILVLEVQGLQRGKSGIGIESDINQSVIREILKYTLKMYLAETQKLEIMVERNAH